MLKETPMETGSFEVLARRFAKAASEAADVTAESRSVSVAARKNKRKKNKRKGDVNKRCKAQAADWATLVSFSCGDNVECQETFLPCVEPLETCNFSGYLQCVVDAQAA
jgi:hypothetical protein